MENSQPGKDPRKVLSEKNLHQEIINDEETPDDGRPDQSMRLIPDPPVPLRFLFKEHIGEFDAKDGKHMKDDVAHRKILAGDHAEDEQSDK
jgi:hypothetical protein